MLLHFQSTMVANGRRTRPQIFISPQSICNDPPSTPPICGCFRGVWKLSAGRRGVVDAAVNSEPLHSGTRGINRRDRVRAIERRRLRHVGWPGFSPNGAVDSRTNGCAGYVSQVERTRRGWPTVCGILYVAVGRQFTGDVGRFQAAVPTGRTWHD